MRVKLAKLFPYLLIVAAAFLIYWPVFSYRFVQFDEQTLILGNQTFLRQPASLLEAFKHDVNYPSGLSAFYRPILTLSLMADALRGGTDPAVYYQSNLFFHLLASLLVFTLLRRLNYQPKWALFLALIFSTHPLLSQAVGWVPGRNDSLLTIWVLISFFFFLNFCQNQGRKNLLAHGFFFALAIFTKETAIALPLVGLFYYWLAKKEESAGRSSGRASPLAAPLFFLIVAWTAILGFWFILRQAALPILDEGSGEMLLETFWRRWPAILVYLGKIVFPAKLAVLPTGEDSVWWPGAAVLLALVIFCLKAKSRSPRIIWGGAWFLFFLLPALVSYERESRVIFLEHRLYLPLIGFLIVLAELPWKKLLLFLKPPLWARKMIVAFLFFIPLALGVASYFHLRHFKDRLSFWRAAVAGSPHLARAHQGLGSALLAQDWEDAAGQAEKEYQEALALNDQELMVHNNLGVLYVNQKKPEQAEVEFKKEMAVNPRYELAYYNLARLYARKKKFVEAEKLWLKAIELKPDYIAAHQDLAVYYFQAENYLQSLYHIEEIVKRGAPLHPELVKARSLLEQKMQNLFER